MKDNIWENGNNENEQPIDNNENNLPEGDEYYEDNNQGEYYDNSNGGEYYDNSSGGEYYDNGESQPAPAPVAEEGFFAFFKTKKWKAIWDKITTGLLILLMATPVLILLYILLWFLNK